jgi:thiamine-phosphate diphosphorylase
MATTQALRHGYAAGRGAGPVRPRADFALHIDNLPTWRDATQPDTRLPDSDGAPTADGPMATDPGALPLNATGATGISPFAGTAAPFARLVDADLGLYAIVDSASWVQRVLDAGVRTVQLRIKDAAQPDLREQIRSAVRAAKAVGAQLFINDHWRIAIDEGAYGVHLGQEDLATADLAHIAAAGLRLGISTHAYWEVCRAWALQPSYIACGPIHPTQAKAMPWIPQGNANLAYWCQLLALPVVAIAGMDAARAREAAACGAAGVAVISAITAAPDPEQAITRLQSAIARGRGDAPAPVPELPKPTLHGAGTSASSA